MSEFKKIKYWLVLLFALFFIGYRAINISMFEHSERRNFMRGDAYSDINLYSAVLYFTDSGIKKTYGLPMHYYKVPVKDSTFKLTAYTHYPALPDLFAYGYSKILNSKKEILLRFAMIFISLIYAILLQKLLHLIIKNEKIVWMSWFLIIISNYYLGWSDSLHKHVYEELFKCGFLICLIKYQLTKTNKWLIPLFFITIIVSNISFEPILYIAIICIFYSIYVKRKIFTELNLWIGLAAVLGVFLHLWQNVAYFGSLAEAIKDLTETAKLRTAGIETSGPMTKLEAPFGVTEYLSMPFVWINRVERFFPIPGFALLSMIIYAFERLKKHSSFYLKFYAIIMLFASFVWYAVMAQHAFVHVFTMRQSGLFFALIMGTIVHYFWLEFKDNLKNKAVLKTIFGVIIILYSLAMFITQHIYDLWIKNTFM